MISSSHRRSWSRQAVAGAAVLSAVALAPAPVRADAGGVGFWLPGSMGSLSAVRGNPAGVSPQSTFTSKLTPAPARNCRATRQS
jgi:hypothetical protein